MPSLKKEYEWLTEPPSQCLQQVALDLSSAFLNFFEKRAKYPNFKKKGQKQSIRFPQGIKLNGDYLTLPKLGNVYCKVSIALKYKSEREGKTYIEVDRFLPSSKTCSNCLYQVENLSLDVRSWQCPKCHTIYDRDINAAINIRDEGLRLLAGGHLVGASGQRVRPSKGTAFRGNAE
uniref:RNA-guided endonuclease InsQ/TnpB family protein n=1 Tax=Aerosakkonema funiforme TaxID=1246630 RepID=UPI002AC7FFD4|nr:zinc ribbon domain-containing protein [Aerosakkonema funiforme]